MGWASGSELMYSVISAVSKNVKDKKIRIKVYKEIIEAFEFSDWDTQEECTGDDDAFDVALYELHPDWKDSEE